MKLSGIQFFKNIPARGNGIPARGNNLFLQFSETPATDLSTKSFILASGNRFYG